MTSLSRSNRFIRVIRPPSPTFNLNRSKMHRLVRDYVIAKNCILDLGSGGRNLSDRVVKLDQDAIGHVNVASDAHQLPFHSSHFDLIVCTSLLEHVRCPDRVVEEMFRCVKPGGLVYVEIPFLLGYHADPHDFQRYTIQGFRCRFRNFDITEVGVCAGPFSVLAWWLRKFFSIFSVNFKINKAIEFVAGWLTFWIKYFDLLVIRAPNAHIICAGIYCIARKPAR